MKLIYTISVRDEHGDIMPCYDVEYKVCENVGEILGMANGDPTYHADILTRTVRTFNGLAQIIAKR